MRLADAMTVVLVTVMIMIVVMVVMVVAWEVLGGFLRHRFSPGML